MGNLGLPEILIIVGALVVLGLAIGLPVYFATRRRPVPPSYHWQTQQWSPGPPPARVPPCLRSRSRGVGVAGRWSCRRANSAAPAGGT